MPRRSRSRPRRACIGPALAWQQPAGRRSTRTRWCVNESLRCSLRGFLRAASDLSGSIRASPRAAAATHPAIRRQFQQQSVRSRNAAPLPAPSAPAASPAPARRLRRAAWPGGNASRPDRSCRTAAARDTIESHRRVRRASRPPGPGSDAAPATSGLTASIRRAFVATACQSSASAASSISRKYASVASASRAANSSSAFRSASVLDAPRCGCR